MDKKLLELLKELEVDTGEVTDPKDLSNDQLKAANEAIAKAAKEAIEARNIDRAKTLIDTKESVDAELTSRAEAEAELESELAKLSDRLKPAEEEKEEEQPEPEAKEEPEPEAKEETKEEAEPEPKSEVKAETKPKTEAKVDEDKKEPIAASAKRKMPETTKVSVINEKPSAVITACAEVPGLAPGQPITDMAVLASAFTNRAQSLLRSPSARGRFDVANIQVDYPKDRQLDTDPHNNTQRIEAVVSDAQDQTSEQLREIAHAKLDDLAAITADGGLCAPVNVSYDVYGVGSEVRPLRDGLVRFQANRGGIKFIAPPTLANLDGSVTIVTEAQDTAGNTDKACLTVTCGSETEEVIDAISKCLQIGNFHHRTFPEHWQRFWTLAGVHHAREAETRLWDRIVANSTAVTAGQVFGASRDIPENLIQAAVGMRSRHRAYGTPVRAVVPQWVVELMSVDRLRQLPGDGTYAVMEAQFRQELAARGIALTLVPDGDQVMGVQGAHPLVEWPTTVEALVFFEGTHLFLDGGELNFGMEIRDSSLNASNNLRAMTETFEGTANVGIESLHVTMSVCPSGESAGTIDAPCGGS